MRASDDGDDEKELPRPKTIFFHQFFGYNGLSFLVILVFGFLIVVFYIRFFLMVLFLFDIYFYFDCVGRAVRNHVCKGIQHFLWHWMRFFYFSEWIFCVFSYCGSFLWLRFGRFNEHKWTGSDYLLTLFVTIFNYK